MPLDAVCDVAYTLLLDKAVAADDTTAMFGGEADHVERLHRALAMNDDDEGEDADVIVLATYSNQSLAEKLFAGPGPG